MTGNTTLRKELEQAMAIAGDTDSEVACFVQDQSGEGSWPAPASPIRKCRFEDLPDKPYDSGYGGTNGSPFIGFSKKFVYVSVQYDGAEWITAVPRHPKYLSVEIPWLGG